MESFKKKLDNDVGTFAMLNYGRNEKMTFCVFIGHKLQKLFEESLFSFGESLHHILSDFRTNFLTKGLFLILTTPTLPTFNGRNCSFDGFWYSVASF